MIARNRKTFGSALDQISEHGGMDRVLRPVMSGSAGGNATIASYNRGVLMSSRHARIRRGEGRPRNDNEAAIACSESPSDAFWGRGGVAATLRAARLFWPTGPLAVSYATTAARLCTFRANLPLLIPLL